MLLTIDTAEIEAQVAAVEQEFVQGEQLILGDVHACQVWIGRFVRESVRLQAVIAGLELYIQELPDVDGESDIDGFSFGAPAAVPLRQQGQFEATLARFQDHVRVLQQAMHDQGGSEERVVGHTQTVAAKVSDRIPTSQEAALLRGLLEAARQQLAEQEQIIRQIRDGSSGSSLHGPHNC